MKIKIELELDTDRDAQEIEDLMKMIADLKSKAYGDDEDDFDD